VKAKTIYHISFHIFHLSFEDALRAAFLLRAGGQARLPAPETFELE